ncbi:MAG: alpha/beta hydrolase [Verrucomicrobiae bacterium]|nr:alpha/beta hydrolase [Verrucomicrobiae bacterium]
MSATAVSVGSSGGIWLVAARLGLGAILIAGIVCVALARWRGDSIAAWQGALLATEFGHWLAILALMAGLIWHGLGPASKPAIRWSGCFVGIGLALMLASPAWKASRMGQGISVVRLFLPWLGPDLKDVTIEEEVYREADDRGPALKLVICMPKEAKLKGARLPWVLSIHGGGWNDGKPEDFIGWDRELASHGYVVAMPAYRLAPSHRWPDQRDDIRDAAAWMRERSVEYGIDPKMLTILGRSAGGQIATACALGVPEIAARGCVALYAPHDLVFARKYARSDDLLDSLKLLRDYLGGDPETAGEAYHSGSAIRLVTADSPRTLLIHGERDTLVWVEQSRRFASRMRDATAPVSYHELPWATHAFDYFPWSPGGQVTMMATLRFLGEGD